MLLFYNKTAKIVSFLVDITEVSASTTNDLSSYGSLAIIF